MRKHVVAAVAGAGVALAACSLVVDTDGLASEVAEGALDGASSAAEGATPTDAPPDDPRETPDADAGADAFGPCVGRAGPTGIRVGTYCIDATEVTVADYKAFLAASPTEIPAPPATCAWNTSYTPGAWPVAGDTLPVTDVDWCDAYMYCAWAGKRLCGAIGGGPTAPFDVDDPAVDQWFAACSAGGTRRRPYGDASADAAVCNVVPTDGGGLWNVASSPACSGGYPGIYDLLGNATEWVDSCTGTAGATDDCRIRESWYGGERSADCATTGVRGRDTHHSARGFRCCSP